MPPSGRHVLLLALATLALAAAPGAALGSALPGSDPVVAAAGDISCAVAADGPTICRDQATSDLIFNQGISRVLALGDLQYEDGALADYNAYYDPTWGRLKDITSPSPGNHEYQTSGAGGYFAYFGARAPAKYYSYDIGQWHLISLDGNSGQVDSTQLSWLDADLAANAGKCTLAYWHHPRFSSGSTHGNAPRVAPFWTELYNAKADIVLNGHEHNYERFAPQDPNAVADPAFGIREFVVGTGGKGGNYPFGTVQPNSEARSASTGTFGVLELALRPGSYEWVFVPEAGKPFTDSGTGVCHSATDLEITKSDAPDPVGAGQTLTYTLTAGNDGPASATGVAVTDNLPSGVSFVSANSSQGSCSEASGIVSCSLGTLASGATATATVTVQHQSGSSVTNTATVQGNQADPDNADNSDTSTTTVFPVADVSLTKTDAPDPVLPGQTLTYTLTARNDGPSSAHDVTVTDSLPAGPVFQNATASQGSCTQDSGTVTCSLGTLASGATATVTIETTPVTPGSLENSATVQAAEPDTDTSDNQAGAQTTVGSASDLSITKTDSPDPALVGQPLSYTLTAMSDGPSPAAGVTITDALPPGTTFESASASQGICTLDVQTVRCIVGPLDAGTQATVTITVRPESEGTITNTAAVDSSITDPDTADNQATEQTTVDPVADLALAMSDSPDPAALGTVLTYTLDVLNSGPSSAGGITLSDTLPKSVRLRSARSGQGRCVQRKPRNVECALGGLGPGESAEVTIKVRPTRTGALTNSAVANADQADTDGSNNHASVQTTVFAP